VFIKENRPVFWFELPKAEGLSGKKLQTAPFEIIPFQQMLRVVIKSKN
jgi:hypothetical protein